MKHTWQREKLNETVLQLKLFSRECQTYKPLPLNGLLTNYDIQSSKPVVTQSVMTVGGIYLPIECQRLEQSPS
jgi:hypothetical protein